MQNKKTNEDIHLRTQFQIDRITFFSDAVIAIAITLLILEIKIPSIGKNVTWEKLSAEYGSTIFHHLIALSICFATIGSLWIRHHELFEFVKDYNKSLIKINLYFLFAIILLPLSISFNLDENNPAALKIFVLIINLFFCHLLFYFMLLIISHEKNCFYDTGSKTKIMVIKKHTMLTTIILLLVSILSLITVKWFYIPFFFLFINRIVSRYKQHKNKKKAVVYKQAAHKV